MKKNKPFGELFNRSLKKTLLIMRIAVILMMLGILQAQANDAYAQKTRLSLNFSETELVKVLDKIEDESEFFFLYNEKLLDTERKVSITEKDQLIGSILDHLFRGTDVKYTIVDRKIILAPEYLTEVAQPQQKRITGTVTDKNGPIPGANVVVTGTTVGTMTDIAGKYSIDVPQGTKSLTFSFIGMKPQEITIGALTQINVSMEELAIGLEEVVVVGYGTQTKARVLGSVSSIKSDQIESITSQNIVTGLEGKLPGLRITQKTGEPGAFTTAFDIRGYGAALVVVDGIVRTDFTRFDPMDIEDITILKDASAAIYGVQSANGVILVTTKKGAIGKPVIRYSNNFSFQKFTVDPVLTNAYEFATLTVENEIANGISPTSTTYSPEDLEKYKNGIYPSTDWLGAIQKKFTTLGHHNLSVSGGNEKVKYFTSLGYLNEGGIWKSDNLYYKRFNLKSNVTINITDNLTADINIDGIFESQNSTTVTADNLYFTAMLAQPTTPLYANNNPDYLQMVNPENVLADINSDYSGYANTKTKTFQSNINLNYKFAKINGLSARAMYSFYNKDLYDKFWRPTYYVYNYNKTTDTYVVGGSGKWTPTSMYENYTPFNNNTFQGQLTYDRIFNKKHYVKADAIFESRHSKNDNFNGNKYFAIDIDQLYAGLAQNATVSSSNIYEQADQSVIGRLNYNYMLKYLMEVGFNYGGSSRFAAGKRWGFFPFTSIGWRASEESFIKDNLPYVTNLKFRASIGKMGDNSAASFQFLTGYNYPSGNYIFGTNVVPGLGFRGLPNPNITWFTATSKNIGFDLDILKGLFTAQFDLFRRDRSGLLATRTLSLPSTVGANLPQENLNSDQQNGFEIAIGHKKKIGEFTYDIMGNFTLTSTKNMHVERAADGNSYLNWINNTNDRLSNIRWGYNYLGQYKTYEEILSSPIVDGRGNKTLRPGDLKYEDVNHDGIISSLDQVPIAKGDIPNINYGLNFSLFWKNLDLNIFFQGAADYSFRYDGMNALPLRWSRNSLQQFMDRWHHEDIFDVNSPLIPGYFPQTGYPDSNNWTSSFWLISGSYLRLKNVELGYTIKNPFLKNIGIQDIRVNVSGLNLLTWSNFKNLDPEQRYVNWIFYSYPINKNLSIGLNVTF